MVGKNRENEANITINQEVKEPLIIPKETQDHVELTRAITDLPVESLSFKNIQN